MQKKKIYPTVAHFMEMNHPIHIWELGMFIKEGEIFGKIAFWMFRL